MMPIINNHLLKLTPTGDNVKIDVTYNAVFPAFERSLANSIVFQERIAVLGMDDAASEVLHTFSAEDLPITAGQGPQSIGRHRFMTVPRETLDEDPRTIEHIANPHNPNHEHEIRFHEDQIRARIEIVPIGLPTVATATGLTNQEVLEPHEEEEKEEL
jgi:hypothetical protein